MDADDDGDRQRFAAPLDLVVEGPEMAADGHEDAQLALARHHEAVVAGVSDPRIRIDGDDDAGRDVRCGVHVIVGEKRNSGEIDIFTELDDFVHRRVCDCHRRDRLLLALGKFRGQLFGPAFQRERHQLAARLRVDHHRRLCAFNVFADEQRKALGLFKLREQRRDLVARRDRLGDAGDLFGMFGFQFGHEAAQIAGHG